MCVTMLSVVTILTCIFVSTHQISQIKPALRELATSDPKDCLTFEIDGNDTCWLQIMGLHLNAAYPRDTTPDLLLLELADAGWISGVLSWEAKKYVTFVVSDWDLNELADWIDIYFVKILGCPDSSYELNVTWERLG